MFIAREKALYQTLNMMKWQNQTFIGYFWAPADEQTTLFNKLSQFTAVKVTQYENHNLAKPTYIKLNDVTRVF